jgi:phosphatidylserine/phosphatidylglycerophosphate/cardiolipin synthase-like enzyme
MLKRTATTLFLNFNLVLSTTFAISFTTSEWGFFSSNPSQNALAPNANTYDIRNKLINKINAAGSGDEIWINGFTWSGNQGAGQYLGAIKNALDNGAKVFLTLDDVDSTNFNNNFSAPMSINQLQANYPTTFSFTQITSVGSNIHHNKFALFDYSGTQTTNDKWVFTSSANYTAGAHLFQWNNAVEIRSPALFSQYKQEAQQIHNGIWHNNPLKNKNLDVPPGGPGISFDGGNGTAWVMFSPPDDTTTPGGDNPASFIASAISNATSSVVIATNKMTNAMSSLFPNAIITAANNGIKVHIVMPQSDISGFSSAAWAVITNPLNYLSPSTYANVTFHTALGVTGNPNLPDDGSVIDLVHSKTVTIDGNYTIIGSANWTQQSTVNTNNNDENTLFIHHWGIAEQNLRYFAEITGQNPTTFYNNIIALIPEPKYFALLVFAGMFFIFIFVRRRVSF